MDSLSLVEASKHVENEELKAFINKFTKLKENEAVKMRKELEALDSLKMKGEHISKIIDVLPEDPQDVSKIFNDVSLDENETQKILEIVKKYK